MDDRTGSSAHVLSNSVALGTGLYNIFVLCLLVFVLCLLFFVLPVTWEPGIAAEAGWQQQDPSWHLTAHLLT